MATNFQEYLVAHRERHLAQLCDFLRIPSISTLPDHWGDIALAAEWVAQALRQARLERVQIMETQGHPVVYGEWMNAPGKPIALIYGHYDVQPVDPVHRWTNPPFAPVIRDGKLFARGASDDKGQTFMHIKAVESILATEGMLPVNVKFCIEGEEEIGSPNLEPFVAEHADLLKADVLVVSDTPMFDRGKPAICYGLRGLCALQIDVRGARSDLHSGLYGGGIQNPIHALVELLASMHDKDGRVAIPHFYHRVIPLTDEERKNFQNLGFDEEAIREELQVKQLFGEKGYRYLERTWARPTLEINGIYGGFQGKGTKTVIPSEAHAKITCRLVADQDPEEILDLIEQHVAAHTPPGVEVTVTRMDHARPFLMSTGHPAIQAAARAYEKGFGVSPVYIRMGGSIPIVETMERLLQLPVVLMGFGLPNENFHAPDEHFHLENFDQGLVTLCHFWHELSAAL